MPTPSPLDASLLEAALAQADLAISITDPQATILYVNPAFCRITGHSAEAVLGQKQSIISSRTTPESVYAQLWATITTRKSWRGRLVNARADGSQYVAELTITPVLDGEGQITHYLGLHRDVSDLHRLERQVGNQKALIESVVDTAPLVLALLDGEERVLLDNHAYKALTADLGMTEAATELLTAVRSQTSLTPRRPGTVAFGERQLRLDRPQWRGPRWYSCSGVWVQSASEQADAFFQVRHEPALLLVATEITRSVMEQEKARVSALGAQIAEEVRRETLREGLAAAAYQMEGPLNVLESVLSIMGRRGCDPAQGALAEALSAGRSALETLSRARPVPDVASFTPVNMNEALRDVLDLSAQRFLACGIEVSWQPQQVLPPLAGSPTRLRCLIKALVDNAVEAMNRPGWAARHLTLVTRSRAGAIELEVIDSGPGLPATERLKAFEPFWSTKQGGEAHHLGTGLPLAQQIAVDHGGSIELGAAPGGGCLARVVMPLRNTAAD